MHMMMVKDNSRHFADVDNIVTVMEWILDYGCRREFIFVWGQYFMWVVVARDVSQGSNMLNKTRGI